MLASLAHAAPARAQAAWTATADDALLFDVRLNQYRLGDGVRGYATPTGPCVDLADVIMSLDLAIRLDKQSRRATGWAFAEGRTVTIDRDTATEQIMNSSRKVAPDDIRDTPEGWCVDPQALSRWLGVEVAADTSNALLMVKADRKLPVEAAAERRARVATQPQAAFDLASLPRSRTTLKGLMPAVDVVASIGGLRDRRSGNRTDIRYEVYAAGEIGSVAYNARLSSDRGGLPQNLRVQAYRTDPDARLLGPLRATYVAAGDVQGISTPLVAQSSVGRGAVVTNRPVQRLERFDRTDFRGELPQGWDAELYRNGQLLAFAQDRSDGRYEFTDIALQYGQNRFEVVLYGPQGQVRRETRSVPVGLDSIPPQKTFYWAGINEDGRDLIGLGRSQSFVRGGWRGTALVERGIDTRTSVAAGLHTLMLEGEQRQNYAEASVRRALGSALVEVSGSASDAGGIAMRGQAIGEFGRTRYGIETIWARGYRSDRVQRDVTGIHAVTLDHSFGSGRTSIPVHLDARYTTRASGDATVELSTRSSISLGRLALTGDLTYRDDRTTAGRDPPATMEAGLLANARIGRVRVRGEARFEIAPHPRLATAALIGEWTAGIDETRADNWRVELGYDRGLSRARAGVGYVRRFERFAISANIEAASDGSVAAGLNLALSLGRDPRSGGGMRVTAEKLATRGSTLVRVWRDTDGDGRRDADEPYEKDVQISAGQVPVEALTDARGEVIVDGLEPYQPVLIGIDASSLPDPFVQPATAGFVVVPRQGMTSVVELPLVSAGEIDGTLVRPSGGAIEGIDLELLDPENRVVARTRSDFDGFFLFESIPYGRYTLRIAALSASVGRLSPTLGGVAIVGAKEPSAHLGTLTAQPATTERLAQSD